jgi:hypothetical protein
MAENFESVTMKIETPVSLSAELEFVATHPSVGGFRVTDSHQR